MSLTAETLFRPYESTTQLSLEMPSDRQADLDAKQALVASLLKETGCEGLLVLEPENFAWLTSGATARGAASCARRTRRGPAMGGTGEGKTR